MRNKIEDLRNHLFIQLERLNDDECDISKEKQRAEALAQVAAVIVDSAKAEVMFIKATGQEGSGTGFIKLDTPT